jgi:hypothetical protein
MTGHQGVELHSMRMNDKSQDYSTSVAKQEANQSMTIRQFNPSFCSIYCETLIDYHVVLAPVLKRSLLDPLWLRIVNLFLYLTIMFGVSALVFTDNYIDLRMADKDRDGFLYPIGKEFTRLALALLYGLVVFNFIKYVFKGVPSDIVRYMHEALAHGDKQAIQEARYIVV